MLHEGNNNLTERLSEAEMSASGSQSERATATEGEQESATKATSQKEYNGPRYSYGALSDKQVAAEQQNMALNRLSIKELTYSYRNLAMMLRDTLVALPVLHTLLDGDKANQIIDAVLNQLNLAKSSITKPIDSDELLKKTGALQDVLKNVEETLRTELKKHKLALKPAALLDFALVARQRHYYTQLRQNQSSKAADAEKNSNSLKPFLSNYWRQRLQLEGIETLLTQAVTVTDGKKSQGQESIEQKEPAKTKLLEQRENPFNPVVTYTEFGEGGIHYLLEQRTQSSIDNTLSDEQVAEYLTLLDGIDGQGITWPTVAELQSNPESFGAALKANKNVLPEWVEGMSQGELAFFVIELLKEKEAGRDLKAFIQSSYSWLPSTFRKTPGRKNPLVDGFRIYVKNDEKWDLIVDEFSEKTLSRGSVPALNSMKLSKEELVRIAKQSMQQDFQQRSEALVDYYRQLFENNDFISEEPIIFPRLFVNLLSPVSSDAIFDCAAKTAALFGMKESHDDNNSRMTDVYKTAAQEWNASGDSVKVGEQVVAPLVAVVTHPINEYRPSSVHKKFNVLKFNLLLSNPDALYDLPLLLNAFVSELNLTSKYAPNQDLKQFAQQFLVQMKKLQSKPYLEELSLKRLKRLKDVIDNFLPALSRTPEAHEFHGRYESLVAYLSIINKHSAQEDAAGTPEQDAAAYLRLSVPKPCRDINCKSAKDRVGMELTKEVSLGIERCIAAKYPGFLGQASKELPENSESPLAREKRNFAKIFLNGHATTVQAQTSGIAALKSTKKVFSKDQKKALKDAGLPEDGLKRMQEVANLNGFKKFQVNSTADLDGVDAEGEDQDENADNGNQEDNFHNSSSRSTIPASRGKQSAAKPVGDEQVSFAAKLSGAVRDSFRGRSSNNDFRPSAAGESANYSPLAGGSGSAASIFPSSQLSGDEENQLLSEQPAGISPESLQKALSVVAANLIYQKDNPSYLSYFFSVRNALAGAAFFVLGAGSRYVVENGFSQHGNWEPAAQAGFWLGVCTYFAANLLSADQWMRRLSADELCRQPLNAVEKRAIRGIDQKGLNQLRLAIGLPAEKSGQYCRIPEAVMQCLARLDCLGLLDNGDGQGIINKTGHIKSLFPGLVWFSLSALTAAGVWAWLAALEDVWGQHETDSNPITVVSNLAGGIVGFLWLVGYAYSHKGEVDHRLSQYVKGIGTWYGQSGLATLSDEAVIQVKSAGSTNLPAEARSGGDQGVVQSQDLTFV